MPCLLVVLALAFPRLVIVLMYLLSNYLERAYQSLVVIVVGFIFLPLTTIVYAWIVNSHYPVSGIYLVGLIVAACADLGLIGHGASRRNN
jgi:ACR3 family arsenite efflux pump ArsB